MESVIYAALPALTRIMMTVDALFAKKNAHTAPEIKYAPVAYVQSAAFCTVKVMTPSMHGITVNADTVASIIRRIGPVLTYGIIIEADAGSAVFTALMRQ